MKINTLMGNTLHWGPRSSYVLVSYDDGYVDSKSDDCTFGLYRVVLNSILVSRDFEFLMPYVIDMEKVELCKHFSIQFGRKSKWHDRHYNELYVESLDINEILEEVIAHFKLRET